MILGAGGAGGRGGSAGGYSRTGSNGSTRALAINAIGEPLTVVADAEAPRGAALGTPGATGVGVTEVGAFVALVVAAGVGEVEAPLPNNKGLR